MKKAKQLLAFSAFLMVVVGLHAEENSTTFTVSATINESCAAVTAQNMAFGLYDPHSSSPVDTTSALCGVLCIAKGWAMGLDISPVHVHLSRQHHIAAVQLTNLSHHSTGLFQVSLYRWQQHGNHNVQKATQALVVTPPMVELSPKQRQIIRVGVVHFLPADHELAYRLVLRQVPMNQHNQVSGLRILLATKLPVFVAPATLPKATFKQVVWRLHANKQYLALTVTNHNKKHIQINGLALSDQHSDHKPFEVPTFVYVLAGQTHTWQIPIKHIDKAAGQWVLAVKANIGHEKVGLPVQKG